MRTFTQRRTVRRTAIAVIAGALFILIGFAFLSWRRDIAPIERPNPAIFSSESVTRGEALAAIGHCMSCHTRPGGQPFAGGYGVAEKAGWGKPLPKDVGLGVASTFGQERAMPTWTACAARVRIDRNTGYVTVEKLTLVIDAGTIIQPNSATAQVEGAALWGLSMALFEGSEFVKGQPKDTNLNSYNLLRMGDVPEVEIEFLPSSKMPVGLSEPATTPAAPAIGNAIFAASGACLRHLPIRPENVREALAHGS